MRKALVQLNLYGCEAVSSQRKQAARSYEVSFFSALRMDGFFRILEKRLSELICTRLYMMGIDTVFRQNRKWLKIGIGPRGARGQKLSIEKLTFFSN